MVENVKIINKNCAYFGQTGTVVNEREEFGADGYQILIKFRTMTGCQRGRLVQLPNGEVFFFGPREIELIN